MILRVKEFFYRVYPREEVMADTRWLLLLLGAFVLEVGLLKAFMSMDSGLPFIMGAAVLIVFGSMPFFWPRAASLSLLTAALVADLVMRRNPFSIIFIWLFFINAFHLLRSQKEAKEAPSEGDANES